MENGIGKVECVSEFGNKSQSQESENHAGSHYSDAHILKVIDAFLARENISYQFAKPFPKAQSELNKSLFFNTDTLEYHHAALLCDDKRPYYRHTDHQTVSLCGPVFADGVYPTNLFRAISQIAEHEYFS